MDKRPDKPDQNLKIVGINIAVLAVYTVGCRSISGGGVLDAMLIFAQFGFCVITALANKSWMWFLAAMLVLIIGFSTCVTYILK